MSEPLLFEELAQDEAEHEGVDTVEDDIIDCMIILGLSRRKGYSQQYEGTQ
jgi:hypothetical protein